MLHHLAGLNLLLVLAGPGLAGAPDLKSQYERGLAAAQRSDCQAALAELSPVLAIEPRLVPAWNASGVCQASLHQPALAVRSFLRVVKLEPGVWQGWRNLASAQLELGD